MEECAAACGECADSAGIDVAWRTECVPVWAAPPRLLLQSVTVNWEGGRGPGVMFECTYY